MTRDPDSPYAPDPGVLKVHRRETPEDSQLRAASEAAATSRRKSGKSPKKKKPGNASGKFGVRFLGLSIGSFVIGMLVFGLFLYHQVTDMGILTAEQARYTRNITVISLLLLLVVEAFTEDLLQGVLCFFLPPYTVIYGLFFADAGPIRGLTIATILFLGAEMYFTPDEALVPTVQQAVDSWIQDGQDKLIHPDGRPEAGFAE